MPKRIAGVRKRFGKTIKASIGQRSILYGASDRVPVLVSLSGAYKKRLNKISGLLYLRYAYGVYSVIGNNGIFVISEDGTVLMSVDRKKVKDAGIDYFNIANMISDGKEIVLILKFRKGFGVAFIEKGGNIRISPFSPKEKSEEPVESMKYNGEWVVISASYDRGLIRVSTLGGREVVELEIPWAKSITSIQAPFNGELGLASGIYLKDSPIARYGRPVVFTMDGKWAELNVCPSTPRKDLVIDPYGPFIATTIGGKKASYGRVFAFPFSMEHLFGPLYSIKSICCGNVLFMTEGKKGTYSLEVLFKGEYREKIAVFRFPVDFL